MPNPNSEAQAYTVMYIEVLALSGLTILQKHLLSLITSLDRNAAGYRMTNAEAAERLGVSDEAVRVARKALVAGGHILKVDGVWRPVRGLDSSQYYKIRPEIAQLPEVWGERDNGQQFRYRVSPEAKNFLGLLESWGCRGGRGVPKQTLATQLRVGVKYIERLTKELRQCGLLEVLMVGGEKRITTTPEMARPVNEKPRTDSTKTKNRFHENQELNPVVKKGFNNPFHKPYSRPKAQKSPYSSARKKRPREGPRSTRDLTLAEELNNGDWALEDFNTLILGAKDTFPGPDKSVTGR